MQVKQSVDVPSLSAENVGQALIWLWWSHTLYHCPSSHVGSCSSVRLVP